MTTPVTIPNEILVDLIKPVFNSTGGIIKQIRLRPPTLDEIAELGAWRGRKIFGEFRLVETLDPIFAAYISRCIVAPGDFEALGQVGARDMRALAEAFEQLCELHIKIV